MVYYKYTCIYTHIYNYIKSLYININMYTCICLYCIVRELSRARHARHVSMCSCALIIANLIQSISRYMYGCVLVCNSV